MNGRQSTKKTKASNAFEKENGNLSIDEKLEKIKDIPYMGQPLCIEQGIIKVNAVSYSNGEKYMCVHALILIDSSLMTVYAKITVSVALDILNIIMK